nr:metal-dependent transcriptional regulator [Rhodothermus marinus]
MLSEAQEDYLKQIFLLGEGEPVSTTALAERLGVRPASVTGMLQKLAALGLVDYRPTRRAPDRGRPQDRHRVAPAPPADRNLPGRGAGLRLARGARRSRTAGACDQ